MKKDSVLVVFGEEMPAGNLHRYDTVISGDKLKEFIEPGSIHEASVLAEELSRMEANGLRISKLVIYQDYELWWMNYNSIFYYFCLPFTQHKKLLEILGGYKKVYFYRPPFNALFASYLSAYGSEMEVIPENVFKSPSVLPFGVFVQMILTLISLPVLMLMRDPIMVFIGDKFEKGKDYDFRMKFIYQELRDRGFGFAEIIRSLESWRTVLKHAFTRKRPAIYSEAVTYTGKLSSIFWGCKYHFDLPAGLSKEERFKFLIATYHLKDIGGDILAIKIMKTIFSLIGTKAVYITTVLERNFHAFIASKLLNLPTVGILHGLPSRYYNVSDFMPGFEGEKSLSVDKYGLWSEWWKEYYLKYSMAYRPDQLFVSGPMRPLEKGITRDLPQAKSNKPRVLFISEQLANPNEVLPYLIRLMESKNVELSLKFRPYRDGFEEWLLASRPGLINEEKTRIFRGDIKEAVAENDVVVGSHSTAVLEALLLLKVPLLFNTKKWGDCFDLGEYGMNNPYFAKTPEELIQKIEYSSRITPEDLLALRVRYFGDPYRNGGEWVVDELKNYLDKGRETK